MHDTIGFLALLSAGMWVITMLGTWLMGDLVIVSAPMIFAAILGLIWAVFK